MVGNRMVVESVLTGLRTPVAIRPMELKSKDEPTGTGSKYLRYLTIGGRPGRAKAKTKTTPAPKLQKQVRTAVALEKLQSELKSLRSEINPKQ